MLPLLYARNHTPGSALIRAAQWWAPWSHVGVLDEERAQVIEARMLQGVIATPLTAFLARYSTTERVDVQCPDPAAGLHWARGQVGAGYDYGALARFVSSALGRDARRAYHCVELAEAALIAAGRPRYRVEPHRLTVQQSYITR